MEPCDRDKLSERKKAFFQESSAPSWPLLDMIPGLLICTVFGLAMALEFKVPDYNMVAIPAIPTEPVMPASDDRQWPSATPAREANYEDIQSEMPFPHRQNSGRNPVQGD